MSFTHLHLHTAYSLLDGACRFEQVFAAAKNMGQTALAITDHGNMFGAVDFYKKAKEYGIKPIIGCEVYVAARSRFDKVHSIDSERYHLVLLCKNEVGYKNLIKIVSAAWTEGFYVKPRIDRELLEKYHEGIIALSACIAGEVPRLLLQNDYEKAKQTALWYNDLFGQGNYYIEIQNHGIREQLEVLPKLIKLARETNIPLVATNDVHYVKKEDEKIQKVLICIQTNHTINEDTGLDFQTDDFYLKSENEMRELFSDVQDAIDNTGIIADMCNFDFEFGKTKLPYFYLPPNVDRYEYFKGQCYKGLKIRYGNNPSAVYTERLDYELSVIKNMGYIDYFLIVADFIDYAKSKDIPVGPGRGSGAGSIAAYCMGITDVDPIKYNLLFERFLNPERVSMPDFDIDFCYVRREEVIEYVIKKYGADHVSQIVTFGTMAARAAIRDVGRALGLSYSTVDLVAKLIPREIGITIEKALLKVPELNELYKKDEIVRELIDTAKSVEGMPRHASKHAAGVVITDKPVSEYVPLAKNDDSVVTQFTMTTIEELGLLKMDFLGLRTLTVISDAQKMIRKKEKDFDIEKISIDDEKTYEMFSKGLTYGVFQCESAGLRNVLMKLKPENLEDI
ncbi:MAG: DNA polymerase III subunit alpha, partial [Oscillospiraceae bacterium]